VIVVLGGLGWSVKDEPHAFAWFVFCFFTAFQSISERSMNTEIWGPPTWRFLHGTSHLGQRHTTAVMDVIETLGSVMPCAHCRDSYVLFTADVSRDRMSEILHTNQYSKWLYDVHNMVVRKLQLQALEAAGVTGEVAERVVRGSYLSYEVLRERLRVSTPYFSKVDVHCMLCVMALSAKESSCQSRKVDFVRFTRAVGKLLLASCYFTTLGKQLSTLVVRDFDADIMHELLKTELRREPTPDEVDRHMVITCIAKAGSCSKGKCL
jgi:hypothetical protein